MDCLCVVFCWLRWGTAALPSWWQWTNTHTDRQTDTETIEDCAIMRNEACIHSDWVHDVAFWFIFRMPPFLARDMHAILACRAYAMSMTSVCPSVTLVNVTTHCNEKLKSAHDSIGQCLGYQPSIFHNYFTLTSSIHGYETRHNKLCLSHVNTRLDNEYWDIKVANCGIVYPVTLPIALHPNPIGKN